MSAGRAERDRWSPASEADLQAAIDAGDLAESHHFDVKREVGETVGDRKNIARHLASLAIDGGWLLIGVEELKEQRSWRLAPQKLDGLSERVDQLAAQVIDPPLVVVTSELSAASGDGRGYLLVQVPTSASAPHMVDGVYYGRGDRTRHKLSDAEVVRLHARREPLEVVALRALDEEVTRDPVAPQERSRGHLYAVAVPLAAGRGVALPLLAGGHIELLGLFQGAERSIGEWWRDFSPSPSEATNFSLRAHGAAVSSWAMRGPGRTLNPQQPAEDREEPAVDLELREDGSIRIFLGRMTALLGQPGQPLEAICDGLAVAYALRLAQWAATVGERCGYRGQWALGIHGDGLRLLPSAEFTLRTFPVQRAPAFDGHEYREVTTADHLELASRPHAVAQRLVGRLARALGTVPRHSDVLDP